MSTFVRRKLSDSNLLRLRVDPGYFCTVSVSTVGPGSSRLAWTYAAACAVGADSDTLVTPSSLIILPNPLPAPPPLGERCRRCRLSWSRRTPFRKEKGGPSLSSACSLSSRCRYYQEAIAQCGQLLQANGANLLSAQPGLIRRILLFSKFPSRFFCA